MKYLDKYPDCKGCPVVKYCGTMVGSIMLCNSYDMNEEYMKEGKSESEYIDDLQIEETYVDGLADDAVDEYKSFPNPDE